MPEYREMVLAGSLPVVKAFLAGLTLGDGSAWDILFHEECGVRRESALHRWLEKLHVEGEETHVLVTPERAVALVRAVADAPARTGLMISLRADRPVREATLEYRFEVFSREGAAAIRQALAALPDGVVAEESEAREREDPSGRGVEVYAPLHEYTGSGHGRLRGPLGRLVELRRTWSEVPMMQLEEIELVYAD